MSDSSSGGPEAVSVPLRSIRIGGTVVEYDDSVLEPRPWTVLQSRWAAELSDEVPDGPILELCCGAGHIGLEAARLTRRPLVQVDRSEAACRLARHNARHRSRSEVTPSVDVQHLDLDEVVGWDRRFPIVLCDPPYIPTGDCPQFDEDPIEAIDGGSDGLALLRRCLAAIDHVLAEGGVALVQVRGAAQAAGLAPYVPRTLVVTEARQHDPERAVLALRRAGAGRPHAPNRAEAENPNQEGATA